MKSKLFILYVVIIFFSFLNLNATIKDKIIAKIGNGIITNYDIINEINTILALSNEVSNKDDFKRLQNIAFSSIKKKIIKKIEIEKYKIEDYNKKDLNNYIKILEKNINLQDITLKNHFKKYGANYDLFVENTIVDLKWNSLIYSLYKKQLDIDDSLVKTKLEEEISKKSLQTEFNLSEIVIENFNEEKLNAVNESLKESGFEKTASLFSSSVSSSNNGLIGWINEKSISEAYLKQINTLKIGQKSNPIIQGKDMIIIKLNDKRVNERKVSNTETLKDNIIRNKKEEKLNIFSNSHYLDLEKKTFIIINE